MSTASYNQPHAFPGAFIVFEGLDGAGSTTQADMLLRWILAKGLEVSFTREPSKHLIGGLLRAHIIGDATFSPRVEALAFAADRLDHQKKDIESPLRRGSVVVADRYFLSSLAYQAVRNEFTWLRELNRYAFRPDVTIYIDVPPEVGLGRVRDASVSRDRYHRWTRLDRIYRAYDFAIVHLRDEGHLIATIDGTRPPSDVHRSVLDAIHPVLEQKYPAISDLGSVIEANPTAPEP